MGSITVVGLGFGDLGQLTRESWQKIEQAEEICLYTAEHPAAAVLQQAGFSFHAYDAEAEKTADYRDFCQLIAEDLLSRAKAGKRVVYAVPGSPYVSQGEVVLLAENTPKEISLQLLPAVSILEQLPRFLGTVSLADLTVTEAAELDKIPFDLPTGLLVTGIYNQKILAKVKQVFLQLFAADTEINCFFYAAGTGLQREKQKAADFAAWQSATLPVCIYAAKRKNMPQFSLEPVIKIMETLRSPGGCPWDIKQTHRSLRRHLLEETYEVLEAIDQQDMALLQEELGDLLLQVVFHARIAEEAGIFSMQDVTDGITEKLVRRHPHIFGDVQLSDAAAVLSQWEEIKKIEKKERKSLLDGIPQDLPSLLSAQKIQEKAAGAGFDWDDIAPVWDKVREELAELREAVSLNEKNHIEEEMGDVFFALVNLARFLHLDAEMSLLQANRKFKQRFLHVENQVKKSGKTWKSFTLAELDEFWNEAKEMKKTGNN